MTRQSPHKPTALSTRYKPVHRPRSSSQDSFARDSDNNHEEKLLLATSEQFALPLSELGKGSSPTRDPSDATGVTSSSSMMDFPRARRQPVTSSPPRGRILVEDTPSQSSGSPSQDEHRSISQRMEESQLLDSVFSGNQQDFDAPMDGDGNGSGYESSEPTSSAARFYREGAKANPVVHKAMEATQPSTQPSTQLEELHADSGTSHFKDIQSILSMPVTASNHSGPGPRSLLSMVRPENRYRYREYGHASNVAPQPPPGPPPLQAGSRLESADLSSIPSLGQETQPSTQTSFPEAPPPRYFCSLIIYV